MGDGVTAYEVMAAIRREELLIAIRKVVPANDGLKANKLAIGMSNDRLECFMRLICAGVDCGEAAQLIDRCDDEIVGKATIMFIESVNKKHIEVLRHEGLKKGW